jgi:hypothetical protein
MPTKKQLGLDDWEDCVMDLEQNGENRVLVATKQILAKENMIRR